MKKRFWLAALAGLLALGVVRPAAAVTDGAGTNHVTSLKVDQRLDFGNVVRTNWPPEPRHRSLGGGLLTMADHQVRPWWASVFTGPATLDTAHMQVDSGTAQVAIVRATWNTGWETYTVINEVEVNKDGVADSSWVSAWVSNDYRVGVLVTNFYDGTGMWWSITYRE